MGLVNIACGHDQPIIDDGCADHHHPALVYTIAGGTADQLDIAGIKNILARYHRAIHGSHVLAWVIDSAQPEEIY